MIYKLDNGGTVKLQSAWTTIPLFDNTATQMFEAAKNSGAQRGTQWYEQRKIVKEAEEKARKQVESEKPKYTYVNPYDYLHGWREATEDAAKQDKYTVENLGGSKEEAEVAYNATKENAAKQLAGTTATGLGTVALLGLSGGAAGPVVADIVNTGFGAHGLYNLASGNGIQKTVRLANQGDTWGAVKSGAGDLLDLSMGLHAAKLWGNLGKSMLAGQSLGNAYRGNIAGREMSNLVRSFNFSKNPFYSNPTVVSTIDHLYKEHPELAEIGPKEAYSQYYKTIFPASKVQIPYAHGTRGDLSKGLEGSTKISYTAAPETIGRNDFYLNLQPEASLQYADGVGVPEGFTWNKHRFWPLKEILGKPYKSDSWMFEPIQLRKQIPNRAGQFSRVKNIDGTYSGHGKLLEEYKAELGMQDLSDKEFLQRFGIKDGETFEQWVAENKQNFSDIYNSGNYHGLYHVKVDASNPLTINGGNTYYSERGIWDTMNAGKNDVLLHNNAANEFGSDVMVVKDVDPSKVRILGSDPDKHAFANFMNGHNISFTPTPQKSVSTVHFDPRVKPLSRPISEAEIKGLPKIERNQPIKQSDHNSRELQRFLKEKSNIEQKSNLAYTLEEIERLPEKSQATALRGRSNFVKEMSDKMKNYFADSDKVKDFNKLLKDYASQIESDIDPRIISTFKDGIEQPSIVVRGFRNYLRNAGVDASELSNEELAKILTRQYKTLSTEATGKLKDDILWHGSPEWFDSFDFTYTGKHTGNGGALGPGNYFSLIAGPYGRTKSPITYQMKLNNTQPYIITGIQSTPNGETMIKKGILSEYIGPAELKTENGRTKLNDIIKSIPKNDNRAYVDLSERAAGMGADYSGPSAGVMVRRNTGIKSLYPHPSRFIRNSDGSVSLIPTDWSDIRVNYKQGGILKAQNGTGLAGAYIPALLSKIKFDPEKIVNRVYGDSAVHEKSILGVAVIDKAKEYFKNSDTAVSDRIKQLEEIRQKYNLNSIDDYNKNIEYFNTLPEEEKRLIKQAMIVDDIKQHEDAKRIYFGKEPIYGTMEPSNASPTIGKSSNPYQVNSLLTDSQFENLILPLWSQWKTGATEMYFNRGYPWPGKPIKVPRVEDNGRTALIKNVPYLSNATLSKGRDEKGDYISLYDIWDYNTGYIGKSGDNIGKWTGGKPFEIYQRYYLDDWSDIPDEAKGNPWIAPSVITAKKSE